MNCTEYRSNLMDHVYGELEPASRLGEMEEHERSCPSCAEEYRETQLARRFLGAWDNPAEGEPEVRMITPRKAPKSGAGFPRVAPRTAFWMAAAAMFVLALSAGLLISGTRLHYSEGVLEVRFGKAAETSLAEGKPMLRSVDRMLAESEERQMQKYLDVIQNVYFRMEQQRKEDLMDVRQGITALQSSALDEMERQSRLLDQWIRQQRAKESARKGGAR